jgi:periplasmic protein TonB
MFGGFDPRSEKLFFARRRGGAIAAALAIYAASVALALLQEGRETTVDVEFEPELKDFAVEEEPPVVEEEPPPPPPPNAKLDVTAKPKPKPKPKIKPPIDKPQGPPPESTKEKTYGPSNGSGDNAGTGPETPKAPRLPKLEPPKPKVEAPKPRPKTEAPIDPDKPIDRPENASAPKPSPDNRQPSYPESLRDAGITGEVSMKLHVHRDGSVRGAKILRKRSSATTEEERTNAEKLFVQAAIAVVKTWKFEPAEISGEAITVWHTVTFPFSLTGG